MSFTEVKSQAAVVRCNSRPVCVYIHTYTHTQHTHTNKKKKVKSHGGCNCSLAQWHLFASASGEGGGGGVGGEGGRGTTPCTFHPSPPVSSTLRITTPMPLFSPWGQTMLTSAAHDLVFLCPRYKVSRSELHI